MAPLVVSRKTILMILVVLVPLGIGTKYYRGILDEWVVRYGGDIASPAFFFFVVLLIKPSLSPRVCALAVFLFCVLVEFSQRISTPLLDGLRGTFPGGVVLGSEFDWRDFVFYAVGILVSLGVYRLAAGRPPTRIPNKSRI